MSTFTYTGELYVEECCNCGMDFGMTPDFRRRMKEDGGTFYCPRGHGQHYTRSDVQRLRDEKEAVERQLIRARSMADQERARATAYKNQARALKGVVTKTKKRAAAGVCPAPGCKRHFANVAAHVARMHPDYANDEQATS